MSDVVEKTINPYHCDAEEAFDYHRKQTALAHQLQLDVTLLRSELAELMPMLDAQAMMITNLKRKLDEREDTYIFRELTRLRKELKDRGGK